MNNTDPDQPVHPHCLINMFTYHMTYKLRVWRETAVTKIGIFFNKVAIKSLRVLNYFSWKTMENARSEQWHLNLHCLQRGQNCP